MTQVQTGIDRLFKEDLIDFKNKKVGLLVHPASVDSKLNHTLDLFNKQPNVNLTQLFGPEHGICGTAQDMVSVDSETDPTTALPVKSLYGSDFESLKPADKDLSDVDILVCDLQDIGARYYTYIVTMAFCMEVCAKLDKEVVVLDRPNPINGITLEGPILKKGFESFVGLYPIPPRHGMTIGELAGFFNEEFNIGCTLEVVRMQGWMRHDYFDNTGLPWILPSPNMPTLETAVVYPGMCLFEATNISEGRGTTRPFELVGAPFIDALELAKKLNHLKLAGITFRPATFRPQYQKWQKEDCNGVQLHVTNRTLFKSYITGIAILKTIIDLYPNDFAWREKPYEFVTDIPAIDLLSGDKTLRKNLEAHASLEVIQKGWNQELDEFKKKRDQHLFY